MNLPVAILAGGLATRLRPVSETIPKSLISIAGEPFAVHQLRLLKRRGIEDVVFCLGYLGERVEAALGDGRQFGLRIRYAFDGERLMGTGGALIGASKLLTDAFFVLYGDSYLDIDHGAVARAFAAAGKPALMTVFANDGRFDASNVEYAGQRILGYSKRERTPRMRHIDSGIGVLTRAALERLPRGEPSDLAELYEGLAREGLLAAHEVSERFYEVGSFQGIADLETHLKGRGR